MKTHYENYETSADFDADMSQIETLLKQVDKLLYTDRISRHAEQTDINFNTNTQTTLANLRSKLYQVRVAFDEHYVENAKAE